MSEVKWWGIGAKKRKFWNGGARGEAGASGMGEKKNISAREGEGKIEREGEGKKGKEEVKVKSEKVELGCVGERLIEARVGMRKGRADSLCECGPHFEINLKKVIRAHTFSRHKQKTDR